MKHSLVETTILIHHTGLRKRRIQHPIIRFVSRSNLLTDRLITDETIPDLVRPQWYVLPQLSNSVKCLEWSLKSPRLFKKIVSNDLGTIFYETEYLNEATKNISRPASN